MKNRLQIALIEPFHRGSHKKWAEGLQNHSAHDIEIYSMPGKFWKWRMHGGAITLADNVRASKKYYDVFLVSDYIDLSLFKALLIDHYRDAHFYIYFHENQLTYPWSPTDIDTKLERDNHYAFINYSSALVADKIFYNSSFHQHSFLEALPLFLKGFPDYKNLDSIQDIINKSMVLPLALDLQQLKQKIVKEPTAILWNHRWEYDKNPKVFFDILKSIKSKNIKFKLIVLGEHTSKYPEVFDWAKTYFMEEIIHWGYVSSIEQYWSWLFRASILPVSSNQDFFGISTVEAIHAGVFPILPNRLAFPDHIPSEHHVDCLYETNEEFETMIIDILMGQKITNNCSSWVSQYDWKNSIEKYDTLLQIR